MVRLSLNPARTPRLSSEDLKRGREGHGSALDKILVTEEQIRTRTRELAAEIDADYAGKDLLLVGVLKGAVMVMADLARELHHPCEMDWMAVSSYGAGTTSSGVVRILKDLDTDIQGRNVLIVEDVIDSGLTLSWLVGNLKSRHPASVEICTMVRKPMAFNVDLDVKYVGFDLPNEFIVGYGLDYARSTATCRSSRLSPRTCTTTDSRLRGRSRSGSDPGREQRRRR